jgi:CheY-like chemotaxis protein
VHPLKRTVLLVDDEPAIRESLRRLLERAGWRVSTAASAADAVVAASEAPPAAIVMDYRMPDSSGEFASGLDLLAALRTRPRLAATPVVMLTGYFLSPEECAAAKRYGARVLYKPADLHAIAARLSGLCDLQEDAPGVA